jgi:hypothetical protein
VVAGGVAGGAFGVEDGGGAGVGGGVVGSVAGGACGVVEGGGAGEVGVCAGAAAGGLLPGGGAGGAGACARAVAARSGKTANPTRCLMVIERSLRLTLGPSDSATVPVGPARRIAMRLERLAYARHSGLSRAN